VVAVVSLALGTAACSSTRPAASASGFGNSSKTPRGSGPVDVLYAGSLVDLMEHDIGPGFKAATGYTFAGISGDSGALANQIKAHTQQADVFISANPSKDALLEGSSNSNLVTWYAKFASSPLVLGYNPSSRFAHDLQSEPWYDVVIKPGFLLGRTDPATDPKGKLTQEALEATAKSEGLPQLDVLATESSDVFAENTLVGRLQAGQLDAGFFYSVEAEVAHFPTVAIPGNYQASYTVTIVADAAHPAGALAFVRYLLGPSGRAALAKAGLVVPSPTPVVGAVPSSLSGVLSG